MSEPSVHIKILKINQSINKNKPKESKRKEIRAKKSMKWKAKVNRDLFKHPQTYNYNSYSRQETGQRPMTNSKQANQDLSPTTPAS